MEDCVGNNGEDRCVPATEQVANRPIIHHVLDEVEAAGVRRIVVASSERSAAEVRQSVTCASTGSGVEVDFVHQRTAPDFGSVIGLVASKVGGSPCIVHAAGGLLGEPLAPLVQGLGAGPDAVVMVQRAAPPERRLSREAKTLLRLAELDPNRSALGMAGVWTLGPGGVRSLSKATKAAAVSVAPGTLRAVDSSVVCLETLTKSLASAGGSVQVRLVDKWQAYRGEAGDLLELNRLVLDRIDGRIPNQDEHGNRIEGRVRIDERAEVRSSVIVGPVVIAADARICDAYIGPYTAIGVGARIEGSEIERSIISAGASIMHVGGRIVASVVGRDARIFRDFSPPRAMRLRVGDGNEVALS